MSTEKLAPHSPRLQAYLQAWGASLGRVLQEVAGAPHPWQELSPEATQALLASLKENNLAVQFEVAQQLSGNQGFVLSKKDAVRLAQLLLAEPEDGSSVMSDDHRDALGELFRQFAGAAASALKGLAGGEVSFKWIGLNSFPGEPAVRVGLQWSSPGLTPLTLVAELGSALVTALSPATPPSAPALELPTPTVPPAPLAPTRDPKLELLMDVELDVTLRFGERQMALRDILDLSAGSVVELNQYVQDPVELLVGKKVIARGEVVVVDGNYGLRLMEIISPIERIESLRK
ncbi:MAG TPA: FliM/FliN family flagellar motor switch protein [Terriglobia bacterium]|nr:FliM/FliN family flagellar motor switch protein [Terriglobia bacterium]